MGCSACKKRQQQQRGAAPAKSDTSKTAPSRASQLGSTYRNSLRAK